MRYVILGAAKSWRPSVSATICALSLSGQELSSSELRQKLQPPNKNLETICHPTSFRVAPWPGFPCLSSVLSHPFDPSPAPQETGSSSQQALQGKSVELGQSWHLRALVGVGKTPFSVPFAISFFAALKMQCVLNFPKEQQRQRHQTRQKLSCSPGTRPSRKLSPLQDLHTLVTIITLFRRLRAGVFEKQQKQRGTHPPKSAVCGAGWSCPALGLERLASPSSLPGHVARDHLPGIKHWGRPVWALGFGSVSSQTPASPAGGPGDRQSCFLLEPLVMGLLEG